jgi:hypothetical protein
MAEVIRMTEAQARQVYKLAKKECCNCYNGFCVLLDTPCPQCITRSLICKWFIHAVLPADMPLYVELTGDQGKSKPCAVCGKLFLPRSNRSKYCDSCAAAARSSRQREYMREKRADG